MRTITVVRFMYIRSFDGLEKSGMIILEIPHDKTLNEEELLMLIRNKGCSATRIIHNDEDIVSEWVRLSDRMLN